MKFLKCLLSLTIVLVPTAKSLPGGYSQVGFSIYKNRQEYDEARNPAANTNPHMANQNDKVLVTYAVGHPGTQGGYDTSGTDLSQAYYEITPQFSNHGQHQRQVESFRQGSSSQPAAAAANYYSNAPSSVIIPENNRQQPPVQVHYSNPYLHSAPQEQLRVVPTRTQPQSARAPLPVQPVQRKIVRNNFYQAPAPAPQQPQSYNLQPTENVKQSLDLSRIIPGIKNNPALTGGYATSNYLSKQAPKPEVVNQNNSPDAAIDAALDERFPLQYFRK